jgi:deoxyribodipyrimidine photo-lyase
MGPIEQAAAGTVIGRDYPAPIVDHAEARQRTLARFSAVRNPGSGGAGQAPAVARRIT